ncbi:hypothetical protein D9613_006174 [Agrocybe pediades]|uniref:Fucose-specific lectin n=1 Tax=Agrocybe pediades TaxID=84607 RepID=A0A8H4QVP9_9AGAR|nr:hypothetical protein D9613_006174 [Agrocybe pediades]
MTQLDDLAFFLLSAGGTADPTSTVVNLLYVDSKTGTLASKPWTGDGGEEKLGHAEHIAESVRPNSTAAYVIGGDSVRFIVYISSENKLCVVDFDEESDEWIEDETLPEYDVHPLGHVTAFLSPDDSETPTIVFQDASERFNVVSKTEGSWSSLVIRAIAPIVGSPITTMTDDVSMRVFYISARDTCLHYVAAGAGSDWSVDAAIPQCSFSGTAMIKKMVISSSEQGPQVYAMDEEKAMWQFAAGNAKLKKAGKVVGNKFDPAGSEEAITYKNCNFYNGHPGTRRSRGRGAGISYENCNFY